VTRCKSQLTENCLSFAVYRLGNAEIAEIWSYDSDPYALDEFSEVRRDADGPGTEEAEAHPGTTDGPLNRARQLPPHPKPSRLMGHTTNHYTLPRHVLFARTAQQGALRNSNPASSLSPLLTG
jgi:hypothetical protein